MGNLPVTCALASVYKLRRSFGQKDRLIGLDVVPTKFVLKSALSCFEARKILVEKTKQSKNN